MKIYSNFNIKKYNTLNIDYIGKIVIEVFDVIELMIVKTIANVFNIKTYIIGLGSKIAFNNYYIEGLIILLKEDKNYLIENNKITLYAGNSLKNLILYLSNLNIGGFHKLSYIPCSISGAVYMNAGINQFSISSFIDKVITLSKDNIIKIYSNKECKFSYRNSVFKANQETILLVTLNTINIDKYTILNDIKQEYINRINTQGYYKYSCGSLYKNNDKKAYKIIKELHLDTLNINGLCFSNKHCNILVNNDNIATYKDLLTFIDIINRKMYEKYHKVYDLELNIYNLKN